MKLAVALALKPASPPPPELSPYEEQRNQRIKENDAFLAALGYGKKKLTPEQLAERERRLAENRRLRKERREARARAHDLWVESRPQRRPAAEAARGAITVQATAVVPRDKKVAPRVEKAPRVVQPRKPVQFGTPIVAHNHRSY